MGLAFGHCVGMTGKSFLADLGDAGAAIRAKYQSKNLGYDVVEFFAIVGIGGRAAIGARGVFVFEAAAAHAAPGRLVIFAAAGATLSSVSLASAAI
jgi:hypothetical protein